MIDLDETDTAILNQLQTSGRLSNTRLAEQVHLSESACLRRVRALEDAGVIEGYHAAVNARNLGLHATVFVHISLVHQDQADLAAFEEAVRAVPEVMECYLMTGEYDYLLRLVLADNSDYERVHREHLTRLPAVNRVHSSFTLRMAHQSNVLPLRPPAET